jgi:pyruvate formate lyase activating enzyme
MQIAGIQKQSFIDWGNKLTAVIFTKGCNFRCGYCHNPSLVLPELFSTDISETETLRFLHSRKGWLDGVVISGGEPTIHAGLKDFIRKIKEMGFPVKLDTNGTNPSLLKELIEEQRIDFVAMDIKSILIQTEYEKVTGIHNKILYDKVLESIELLKQNWIPYQFRTTVIPAVHPDEMINELKQQLASCPYVLQAFRNDFETVADVSVSGR